MSSKELNFEQRICLFWSKVDKSGPTPPLHPEMTNCWIWIGPLTHDGYGRFKIGHTNEKKDDQLAHRTAFFLFNGYWPKELDHQCHVRSCVRMGHFKETTHVDNTLNRAVKICVRGHPLEDPNLYYYPNGKRRCKACCTKKPKS